MSLYVPCATLSPLIMFKSLMKAIQNTANKLNEHEAMRTTLHIKDPPLRSKIYMLSSMTQKGKKEEVKYDLVENYFQELKLQEFDKW